jgi:hypothetical protein
MALDADELQYQRDYGPCMGAGGCAQMFLVADIQTEQRWPDYAERSAAPAPTRTGDASTRLNRRRGRERSAAERSITTASPPRHRQPRADPLPPLRARKSTCRHPSRGPAGPRSQPAFLLPRMPPREGMSSPQSTTHPPPESPAVRRGAARTRSGSRPSTSRTRRTRVDQTIPTQSKTTIQ